MSITITLISPKKTCNSAEEFKILGIFEKALD